jgi:hypothetical protein
MRTLRGVVIVNPPRRLSTTSLRTVIFAHSLPGKSFWPFFRGQFSPDGIAVAGDEQVELAPAHPQTLGRLHPVAVAPPKRPVQQGPLQGMKVGRKILGFQGLRGLARLEGQLAQKLPAEDAIAEAAEVPGAGQEAKGLGKGTFQPLLLCQLLQQTRDASRILFQRRQAESQASGGQGLPSGIFRIPVPSKDSRGIQPEEGLQILHGVALGVVQGGAAPLFPQQGQRPADTRACGSPDP